MRDISKNIKQLRIQKGMTQDELAEVLFVTRQTVSNYETGKSRPDVDMLVSIAAALDTDVNTVIYGEKLQDDRNKKIRNAVIMFVVLFILIITATILKVLVKDWYRSNNYYVLYIILLFVINPLLALASGWCTMHGLGVLLRFSPISGKYIRWIKYVLIAITLVLILVIERFLIPIAIPGKFGRIIIIISDFVIRNPIILSLFSAALWIFGFPKKKDASK